MSVFTGPLDVRHNDADWHLWTLLAPLAYEADHKGSGRWIVVPDDFSTDGASVPRTLWGWLPSTGRYLRAAVVHDYLYSRIGAGDPHPEAPTKRAADREFRIAMAACGVRPPLRWIMWAAVSLFGRP